MIPYECKRSRSFGDLGSRTLGLNVYQNFKYLLLRNHMANSSDFIQKSLPVVVWIFNATRHPRHIAAAAIVMYMYLYCLVFMDYLCRLGAAVCHQAPPCPVYTQSRARRV